MITTMDRAGRLVIPKKVRDEVGLVPGEPLNVTIRDGCVEITPAPRPVRIAKKGSLTVAESNEPYGSLDEETVRRTRKRIRDSR